MSIAVIRPAAGPGPEPDEPTPEERAGIEARRRDLHDRKARLVAGGRPEAADSKRSVWELEEKAGTPGPAGSKAAPPRPPAETPPDSPRPAIRGRGRRRGSAWMHTRDGIGPMMQLQVEHPDASLTELAGLYEAATGRRISASQVERLLRVIEGRPPKRSAAEAREAAAGEAGTPAPAPAPPRPDRAAFIDPELDAMRAMLALLAPLGATARLRAAKWLYDRMAGL